MLVSVKWENGDDVYISAGKLKGYLDMRDGTGITAGDETKAMGIPYFINKINVFANSIAETVNEIHKQAIQFPTLQTAMFLQRETCSLIQATVKNYSKEYNHSRSNQRQCFQHRIFGYGCK